MSKINLSENKAQVQALTAWFQSQDIDGGNALVTMGLLCAVLLAENAGGDVARLAKGLDRFAEALRMSTVLEFKLGGEL